MPLVSPIGPRAPSCFYVIPHTVRRFPVVFHVALPRSIAKFIPRVLPHFPLLFFFFFLEVSLLLCYM